MKKSLKWAGITQVRLLEHLTSRQAKAMKDGEIKLNPHFSTGYLLSTPVPLRRRVQDFIDRRFYLRMYGAENALADFAAADRNETDVGRLSSRLTGTIQETLQPEAVSLWMQATALIPPRPSLPGPKTGLTLGEGRVEEAFLSPRSSSNAWERGELANLAPPSSPTRG